MESKTIYIKKSSGVSEQFSFEKLQRSLQKSGASNKVIEAIIKSISPQLYDGILSKEIYKKAFRLLKKANRVSASKYSLKRAIFDLGPTGYPFERLVSAILRQKGYKTQVGVLLQGECVNHEIDVLVEKEGVAFTVECKFHSNTKTVSNVKIPLYINSRFLDVQKEWNKNTKKTSFMKQGWIVTNTRFTEDAIKYGKCVGLELLSWNYPENNGISKNIDQYALYPITTLTALTKREKELLIEHDIILIQELLYAAHKLKKLQFSAIKIGKILSEVQSLCEITAT